MTNRYELERTTIVDHAGTDERELFVTGDFDILEREIRYALEKPHGGFTYDVFEFAWRDAIARSDREALSFWLGPELAVYSGGKVSHHRLIPDCSIKRGDLQLEFRVDRTLLAGEYGKRRRKIHEPPVFTLSLANETETFNDLKPLGGAGLLDKLRAATGDVEVQLDLTGVLDPIPRLSAPFAKGLRFVPQYEDRAQFEEYWEEESKYLFSQPWDGIVQLDTWFPLQRLEDVVLDGNAEVGFEPIEP